MSMPGPWDLPRRIRMALVSYCKQHVDGDVMVIPARNVRKVGYPLIICEATGHQPMDDSGNFTGRRRITGAMVVIKSEAINQENNPEKYERAQEIHAGLQAVVVGALAGNTVHDDINAFDPQGVAFSRCMMGDVEEDGEAGFLLTTIELEIEAQPRSI
jgi:hypothetical protein